MIDALEDLLSDMFIELPNCPRALCLMNLRLAAREFCKKTDSYEITLDPIDIEEDTITYNLDTGFNGSISRLIEVKIGEDITDDNDTTTPIDPSRYRLDDEFTLVLYDTPSADITDGLVVKVAVRPDFDTEAPLTEWFLERYSDVIVSGAKYRLMRMSRKPWTDRELAMIYKDEFDSGMGDAKAERFRGFKMQDTMIANRSFDLL